MGTGATSACGNGVTADLEPSEPPAARLRRCDGDTGPQKTYFLRDGGSTPPLRPPSRRVRKANPEGRGRCAGPPRPISLTPTWHPMAFAILRLQNGNFARSPVGRTKPRMQSGWRTWHPERLDGPLGRRRLRGSRPRSHWRSSPRETRSLPSICAGRLISTGLTTGAQATAGQTMTSSPTSSSTSSIPLPTPT
jgi:hypothetical protein